MTADQWSFPILPITINLDSMVYAFNPDFSDFSGMNRDRGEELFINDSQHKTFISVDEEGTEAAAATSVGIGVVSAPPHMRIDRPFFYAIREVESNTILFMGKMNDPS